MASTNVDKAPISSVRDNIFVMNELKSSAVSYQPCQLQSQPNQTVYRKTADQADKEPRPQFNQNKAMLQNSKEGKTGIAKSAKSSSQLSLNTFIYKDRHPLATQPSLPTNQKCRRLSEKLKLNPFIQNDKGVSKPSSTEMQSTRSMRFVADSKLVAPSESLVTVTIPSSSAQKQVSSFSSSLLQNDIDELESIQRMRKSLCQEMNSAVKLNIETILNVYKQ